MSLLFLHSPGPVSENLESHSSTLHSSTLFFSFPVSLPSTSAKRDQSPTLDKFFPSLCWVSSPFYSCNTAHTFSNGVLNNCISKKNEHITKWIQRSPSWCSQQYTFGTDSYFGMYLWDLCTDTSVFAFSLCSQDNDGLILPWHVHQSGSDALCCVPPKPQSTLTYLWNIKFSFFHQ